MCQIIHAHFNVPKFRPMKGRSLQNIWQKFFKCSALAGLMLSAAVTVAFAREPLIVATPFEVGETRAGNYLAALIAGSERDTLAASTFFQEALRLDPRNGELIERAFLSALANGDMDAAFELARIEQRINPRSGLAILTLAVQAIHDKKFDKAVRYLQKQGASGRDVTSTLLTAWALEGAGKTKQAVAQVDKLKDPSLQVFRNYHSGMMYNLSGNKDHAADRLATAYRLDSRTLRLVDAYARFLSRDNREAAIKTYQAFDKLLPKHPIVAAAIADLNAGKNLPELIVSEQDGAAEVLFGFGAAGGQQGEEIASMIYLRLSLYLKPDNGLARLTLADLYERLKQNELAIDTYEMIADADPMRMTADIQTAIALEILGKTDLAVNRLNEIIAADPKNLDAMTSLGNIYLARKNFPAAESAYSKAIVSLSAPDARNWLLYYRRGTANERLKQWPQAEADLKKALDLSPEQPQVLNYLGYSWIDMGVNLDQGFKMLRRAVELRPNDGYIVDSLGWAQYKLGHYDEAVNNLEKAVALPPADSTINDHLGDAYWRVGRKQDAKFQWNHARDFGPDPDDLVKIVKKIENGLEDVEKQPVQADGSAAKQGS